MITLLENFTRPLGWKTRPALLGDRWVTGGLHRGLGISIIGLYPEAKGSLKFYWAIPTVCARAQDS